MLINGKLALKTIALILNKEIYLFLSIEKIIADFRKIYYKIFIRIRYIIEISLLLEFILCRFIHIEVMTACLQLKITLPIDLHDKFLYRINFLAENSPLFL